MGVDRSGDTKLLVGVLENWNWIELNPFDLRVELKEIWELNWIELNWIYFSGKNRCFIEKLIYRLKLDLTWNIFGVKFLKKFVPTMQNAHLNLFDPSRDFLTDLPSLLLVQGEIHCVIIHSEGIFTEDGRVVEWSHRLQKNSTWFVYSLNHLSNSYFMQHECFVNFWVT